jgi:hypothetical protein
MNAKRKGNHFEVWCAAKLRDMFPNCYTSRFVGALWSDRSAIDLQNTPGFHFQCKATEKSPPYHDILDYMPSGENMNVILHKRNNKGVVAVMGLDDFLELVKAKLL